MLTPEGYNANHIEKVMLLSMWASFLNESNNKIIFAGLGKPTFPMHKQTIKTFKSYWDRMNKLAENWSVDYEQIEDIPVIDYGSPYGDKSSREIMAKAMSKWYNSEIFSNNILFTVGGIGGLKIIFEALNNLFANQEKYRVITPFPYYSAYSNNLNHILHPINVMSSPGYQLTAESLEKSIINAYEKAKIDRIIPRAVLICNPSNPLGTIIKEDEIKKISYILDKYPDLYIILDEAYAEMNFITMPSFLDLAPKLKNRTIILRSATKALSAAGERMAVILAFDNHIMNELINTQIRSYIHPPRSGQLAYSETMLNFTESDRKKLSSYYEEKVNYVQKRLKSMGADMPDTNYKVEATFYVLGNFSELFGLEMPEGIENAIEKSGVTKTDEDLAYYLLFKDFLMLTPLSYFGLSENAGYLRITCTGKQKELEEIMNILENRLTHARALKKIAQKNYCLENT